MGDNFWIVPCGFVACFAMAMCMGANDVANAFGTSVGSGVITMRQAYVIAGVMNFLGAVSMSNEVTQTIRKGIVELKRFSPEDDDDDEGKPGELMLLMLCAMLGSVAYVSLATYRRMPVSTTQAVLGGLVGGMIAFDGPSGVKWRDSGAICAYHSDSGRVSCGGIVGIVLQWFVAPLISCLVAAALFAISRKLLLKVDRETALRRAPPLMAFYIGVVAFAISWFIIVQQQHHPHSRGWDPRDAGAPVNHATALEVVSCILVGLFFSYTTLTIFSLCPAALTFSMVVKGASPADKAEEAASYARVTPPGDGAVELGSRRRNPLQEEWSAALDDVALDDEDEEQEEAKSPGAAPSPFDGNDGAKHAGAEVYDAQVERVFGTAQICSASLSAFAAGANDVANEVAPIAAIWQTYQQGKVVGVVRTPHWLYAYAAAGVCVGLAAFGSHVMRTVGQDCTKITPSRGFNIELGYALASLIASAEGWPVSTTQLCVGAVVGVAIVSGEDVSNSLNKQLLFRIFASWVATPFSSGLVAALCFVVLRPALS